MFCSSVSDETKDKRMKLILLLPLFFLITSCTRLEQFDYQGSADYKWLQKTIFTKGSFSVSFLEWVEKKGASLKMAGFIPGGPTFYEYFKKDGKVVKNYFAPHSKIWNHKKIISGLAGLYLEAFDYRISYKNKTIYGKKEKIREIEYGDFKKTGALNLPNHIAIHDYKRDIKIDITLIEIKRYEYNQ